MGTRYVGRPPSDPQDLIPKSVLDAAVNLREPTISAGSNTQYWRGDKSWQTLNAAAVGLGNVNNTSDVNKPVSTAQQTALNGKEPTIAPGGVTTFYRGDKQFASVTKLNVGLGNVDNTADVDKPISLDVSNEFMTLRSMVPYRFNTYSDMTSFFTSPVQGDRASVAANGNEGPTNYVYLNVRGAGNPSGGIVAGWHREAQGLEYVWDRNAGDILIQTTAYRHVSTANAWMNRVATIGTPLSLVTSGVVVIPFAGIWRLSISIQGYGAGATGMILGWKRGALATPGTPAELEGYVVTGTVQGYCGATSIVEGYMPQSTTFAPWALAAGASVLAPASAAAASITLSHIGPPKGVI